MGGHFEWHQQFVELLGLGRGRDAERHFRRVLLGLADDEGGQSTVEYVVVMAAGLAIIVAVGALANVASDGMFVEHAAAAASHHLRGVLGGVADVFSY